ncbi:ABC transporter ATP-binding protein/permease [Nocardia sp. CDC159]|uniref:ABC transporter ATP-binding protein/permease n=1 Tax=Nocardia pulmonis TaxID=2951408 RepID=A0A9X2E1M1_9NOCA|nr:MULTISPECIES: ABC transporter ATP-binding protein [Nocardia]MCM6771951.1 ABC transporter ATP-binding protein/permease [Nocardia pulmonis]MCM6785391.1 ABC transporter ATP-binding protein/permease [Nocardia sp. CDC159]
MSAPEPTTPRLRTASARASARWVAEFCRRTPLLTVTTIATSIGGAALQIIPFLLLSRIIDTVTGGGDRASAIRLGALMVAAGLSGAVVTAISVACLGRLGALLVSALREGAMRTVLALPIARVETAGRGDVLSRVGDDVAVVSRGLRTAVPELLSAAVLVGVAVASMFGLDWRLGLAGAVALPAYALALRWYLPRSAPLYRAQREAQGDRADVLIGGLDGIDTIRAYGLERQYRGRVTEQSLRVRDLGIRSFHLFGRFVGRENRAELIGLAAVLTTGFALTKAGMVTLGAAAAAPLLFHRLFNPLGMIMYCFDEAQKSGASLTRLVGVLAEPSDRRLVRSTAAASAPATALRVALRGVRYRYAGSDTDAVRGIDLDIAAGATVALVGASGAGKSTLAALVAGVLAPNQGRISLGDTDIGELDEAGVRERVALSTQQTHVFAGTLAADLRLAAPDAEDDELRAALAAAGAADWVADLPDGLDTRIGAGGLYLDPTRAAQLALARIILGRAPVVVLDESTAEAGSHGAAALEQAARTACAGRTALLVAHRLTQAVTADLVAVMDAGQIVEIGTHDELRRAGGHYARLWAAWSQDHSAAAAHRVH